MVCLIETTIITVQLRLRSEGRLFSSTLDDVPRHKSSHRDEGC
jgi:hypothetical protein